MSVTETRVLAARVDPGAVGAWALGFAVVAYLALRGGGYDVVVRSQVGVALWWILLVGAVLGVIPHRRLDRPATAAIALLLGFAAWSALSAIWSESPERAIDATARIFTLAGLFTLALIAIRGRFGRPVVHGVFAAIAGVAVLACVSRLQPGWFGTPETAEFLPSSRARLSYPLNYWNGLGALLAMGLPIGLSVSMTARSLAGRAAAIAVLPSLALTLYLTLSRGGVIAAAVALVVAFALTEQRGRWLAKLGLATVGAAILVKGALQRDVLRDGLATPLARHQGDELLILVLFVTAGLALVQVGATWCRTAGLVPQFVRTQAWARRPRWVVPALVAIAILGVLAAGAGTDVSARWQEFKNPNLADTSSRVGSASGNGRYQFWASAVDAFESAPVAGIGAGSYESWWSRHATLSDTTRNAHSLVAETLAELGLIGLALLGALFAVVLVTGARQALRSTGPPRVALAGVVAACAAFVIAAAIDWIWLVTVLPACFLLLAAVVLANGAGEPRTGRASQFVLGGLAVVALFALAGPLGAASKLRESERSAATADLAGALKSAQSAGRLQPYAASPDIQRALVYELAGNFGAAIAAAQAAERKEPNNWRPPFLIARFEAARGDTASALVAYRRARSLNPESSVLR